MSEPFAERGVPWWPDSISSYADSPAQARADWGYVVVEEVAGAVAELVRWAWPLADQLGHLVWPAADQEGAVTATVALPVLRELMYLPSGLHRNPRSGDTFAAELGGAGWSDPATGRDPVTDLRLLFPGTVVDISADARDAAKLAYQGASAAVYDGTVVGDLPGPPAGDLDERIFTPPEMTILPVPGSVPGDGGPP